MNRIEVDLTGRTALVTGSSRGLGRALALRFAASGANVVITYRKRHDEALTVAAEAERLGATAWVQQLDLEDLESIERLFAFVGDGPGQLDTCILNAAATAFRPLLAAEPRHLNRTFDISCVGFLRSVQLAVPLLEPSGGSIIGVSGADTRTVIPAHGILAAAKAAMEAMIRYLAVELGPTGVTILGVNPGTIMGESIQAMLGDLYRYAEEAEQRTHPFQHGASPEEIAEPIVLLATRAARWMHGSIVDLDGGSIFAMCSRWMNESAEYFLARDGITARSRVPD